MEFMDEKAVNDLGDAVNTIRSWMAKSASNVTPEIKQVACELFKIGKSDLEVSKLAYDVRKYPQAISMMQQAIEKLGKSAFLITGQEKPEKLATHYYYEGVSKNILDTNAIAFTYFKQASGTDLDVSADFSQIKENQKKLRELPKENIILFFESFEDGGRQILDDKYLMSEVDRQLDFHKGKIDIHHLNVARKNAKEDLPKLKEMLFSVLQWAKLTSLIILLTSHYQSARYPYDRNGNSYAVSEYFEYIESLGIVETYPVLFREIENLFSFFGKNYGMELNT
mgnify:CR=1 FL=1